MSDPTIIKPAAPPPPPVSITEEGRGSSTTSSSPKGHVAVSSRASAGSPSIQPTLSPPSLPSSGPKAPPSVSGSRTTTLTATSPPTTVSIRANPAHATSVDGRSTTGTMSSLDPHLPSHSAQLHVAEARAALVASMSNMLDGELQSRATLLHSNASALSRQEQDVARATEALRKENDKLARVARDAGRKIKELGNVQNWAEVLERDFLVLEETMRLVRGGDGDGGSGEGESCSECSGSSYWSGSESGSDQDEGLGEGGRRRRVGSSGGSRRGSVGEEQQERHEDGVRKGKEVDRGAINNDGSDLIADGGSATSNASLAGSASNSSRSTNATVSLDEAILESLMEAMTTDMRIGSISLEQDTLPLPSAP